MPGVLETSDLSGATGNKTRDKRLQLNDRKASREKRTLSQKMNGRKVPRGEMGNGKWEMERLGGRCSSKRQARCTIIFYSTPVAAIALPLEP